MNARNESDDIANFYLSGPTQIHEPCSTSSLRLAILSHMMRKAGLDCAAVRLWESSRSSSLLRLGGGVVRPMSANGLKRRLTSRSAASHRRSFLHLRGFGGRRAPKGRTFLFASSAHLAGTRWRMAAIAHGNSLRTCCCE